MATFEIINFKSNDFRALLKSTNTIEFTSVACNSKRACYRIINVINRNIEKSNACEIKSLSCGSWYFLVKNPNTKEILGRSNTYLSKLIAEKKLKQIKEQTSHAIIENN